MDRGAPEFFDVADDQLCAFVVGDVGGAGRVVHGVGQVAHEGDVDAPLYHLFDAKGAVEDAHVGVHAHQHHLADAHLLDKVVNLLAVVRDAVPAVVNVYRRVLSRPDPYLLGLACVRPSIRIVDGQRRRRPVCLRRG